MPLRIGGIARQLGVVQQPPQVPQRRLHHCLQRRLVEGAAAHLLSVCHLCQDAKQLQARAPRGSPGVYNSVNLRAGQGEQAVCVLCG